jgi:dTDP-4-amino-4,6-dideoxygalactose transaminase
VIALTAAPATAGDLAAVEDCYRSGWLTMGPRTQELEAAFALASGARHAVAVSSGTSALQLALVAAGVGPGDDVLAPALAFPGLGALVGRLGGRLVFCDVRSVADHTLDPRDVERRLTPRTRAIVVDHRWGYLADLQAVLEPAGPHGVAVIEDAAHAVLARGVGRGLAACYSLSSTKQLAIGEGGLVTTDDDATAARIRSLRSHAMTSVTWDRHRGHATTYDVVDLGHNARLDEPRAALALSRLGRLPGAIARRRDVVRAYRDALAAVPGVVVPHTESDVAAGSHGAFGILLESPTEVRRVAARAAASGIETRPLAREGVPGAGLLANATEVARRGLRLPLHETVDVEAVVAAVAGR